MITAFKEVWAEMWPEYQNTLFALVLFGICTMTMGIFLGQGDFLFGFMFLIFAAAFAYQVFFHIVLEARRVRDEGPQE